MGQNTTPRSKNLRRNALTLLGSSVVAVLGVLLGTASPAAAADQTIDLYAVQGSTTLPGLAPPVPVLGYNDTNTAVDKPGGPVITVNQGDSVTINLHNELGAGVQTSLLVEGQPMQPDLTGVGNGAMATYTFTAGEPGTYLYEAGLLPNTQYQTAMGLHGALVVLPTSAPDTVIAGQAYEDPSTAFDSASVLVLSEIDPVLNNTADPSTFDMRTYRPRYFLVNGKAHPQIDAISAAADSDVLLRYVNAGITNHSMGVLGAQNQKVIALDGFPLRDARHYVADTIGPGQTLDALVHTPASASVVQRLSVYDAGFALRNGNSAGLGGMLATVEVAANGDPVAGAPLSRDALFDTGTNTLTATVDDSTRGGQPVTSARAFLDELGGTPIDLTGAFGTATVDVTGSITIVSGEHTIYVQGSDDGGTTWGPLTSVLVTGADAGGPTVVQPVLTPNVTRQPAPAGIAIDATGDDSSTGNSNVTAAEYSIGDLPADAGTGTPMDVPNPSPVAELTGTIDQGVLDALLEGNHPVWVRAQDAGGNWGEAVTVNLAVDLHAPEIQGGVNAVEVAKSPNNGRIPLTPSQQFVRVSVPQIVDNVYFDVSGTVAKVEMFLDTQGTNGAGIPMTASDGLFNDQAEGAYGNIPLSTVRQMTDGEHDIWVHARDNAGNWGDWAKGTLLVDKTAPAIASLSITPSPAVGAATLTVNASVTEALTGVTAAEWFIGATPAVGTGTPLGSLSATGPSPYAVTGTISAADLGEGTFAIRVRFQDGAGNWGTTSTVSVTVTPALYYSTVGNTSPPSVSGSADNSDIYLWNGSGHSRVIDASTAPYGVPGPPNVDGFDRVDDTHFYMSFSPNNTNLPGLSGVRDEDVVYYDNGTWSMFFDGSAHGLTAGGQDLDAINVSADGTLLFFSTIGNATVPGVGGVADSSDIYRFNATTDSFIRVFDATANGLPGNTNVDGVVWVSTTQLYLSFAPNNTAVAGLGNVPDENVVFLRGGVWRTYFDGAGHGLNNNNNLDIDAFDLP